MGNAKKKNYDDQDSYLDELAPGTELLQGQYKIVEFLNSGGFGITYLATDSLDRRVVIKECFPSSFCNRTRTIVQARSRAHTNELRSVVQLFVQEARSLSKLKHPNIVGVHQVFEDNETAYMVLDFVEGRDLLDTIEDENHGLTAPQIKGILKDVLGAVQFIHDQDILHRDISPDNILLDKDMRPVLIDFGAAREEATKKSRVLSAMRVVKDGYSPQEFYVQGSAQSPSSDLYALAATFYHLIDGEIPPNSQARLAAIASGDKDPYIPLVGRSKGFDSRVLRSIDKAMGVLPKDRMQSANEWLDALESGRLKSRVVSQQVPLSSAAAATIAPKKRSVLVPLMGSVAVVALLAVGGLVATENLPFPDDALAVAAPVAADVESALETAPSVQTATAATLADAQATNSVVNTVGTEAAAPLQPSPDAVAEAPEEVTTSQTVSLPEVSGTTDVAEVLYAAPRVEQLEVASPDAPVIAASPAFAPAEFAAPVNVDAREPLKLEPAAPVANDVPVLDPQEEATRLAALEQVTGQPVVIDPSQVALVSQPVDETGYTTADPAPELADAAGTPVRSTFRVGLPFVGQQGSNAIAEAAVVAPIWVRPGARIMSVNGIGVSDIAEIDTIAEGLAPSLDTEAVTLTFTVQSEDGAVTSVHDWAVPVRHETVLPNGIVFQASVSDDTWTTKVTSVPNGSSELKVGDEVVAYVPTTETLKDRDALHDIIARELAQGTEQFSFAVNRGGSMWVVSMNYAVGE